MASVWKRVLGFFALMHRPMAAISCTAPISLFTVIMETIMVSSRIAFSKSVREICPFSSTGRTVKEKPCCSKNSKGLYTAGCSMAEVMMCFPCLSMPKQVPIKAVLLDSVPPEVKIISFSLHFKVFAMVSLASR